MKYACNQYGGNSCRALETCARTDTMRSTLFGPDGSGPTFASRRSFIRALAVSAGAAAFFPASLWAGESALDFALRGQNLLDAGKTGEALKALLKAADKDPESGWIMGLLGRAYHRAGKPREAVGAFRKAVALDPGDTFSRMMIDRISQYPLPRPQDESNGMTPLERAASEEEERVLKRIQKQESGAKLGYRVRNVVLDAGHGGFDSGAVGVGGLQEKDVALDIVKKTLKVVERDYSELTASPTRTDDYFLTLSDRTVIAERRGADLFVSFHINAGMNRSATGLETYYCSEKASDVEAERTASFENSVLKYEPMVRKKGFVDVEDILFRFERKRWWSAGGRAAAVMKDSLVKDSGMKDRGVKSADFYVLRKARMPSVLLELGFISNAAEEGLLGKASVRQQLAEAAAASLAHVSRQGI